MTGRPLLHLIDTGGPGGAETVFAQVATGLAQRGYPATAVVSRDDWLAARLRAGGIEPRFLPSKGSLNLAYLSSVVRLLRHERPAALITHLLGPAIYGSLAGLLTGTPVVAVLHGQSDMGPKERLRQLKSALIRQGATRVVFVSEQLRDALLPRLGLMPQRTLVITNGVDVGAIAAEPPAPLREECGIDRNAFVVGAVGNIRRPKAYDILLRAARVVVDQVPRVRFVIAGDPARPLYDDLLRLRAELGLERHVHFLGLRKDVPALLRAFDAFVSSSTTEGFSIACCEAMAAGVPVVATRSGGPQQILDGGRCGVLVEPLNPEALASALVHLSDDEAARQCYSATGRQRVKQEYSLERMLDAYQDLLRPIIAQPG